jgi:hypothetical protein
MSALAKRQRAILQTPQYLPEERLIINAITSTQNSAQQERE